jgi:hypothetical protein
MVVTPVGIPGGGAMNRRLYGDADRGYDECDGGGDDGGNDGGNGHWGWQILFYDWGNGLVYSHEYFLKTKSGYLWLCVLAAHPTSSTLALWIFLSSS